MILRQKNKKNNLEHGEIWGEAEKNCVLQNREKKQSTSLAYIRCCYILVSIKDANEMG